VPADYDLHGRIALITGAARGIGAESARRLASRGATIALVGLEPEEMGRVAAECGNGSAAFEADVTDREQLGEVVDEVVERFGGIDVCMANAGIGGGGPVRLADPAYFEKVVEVNLLGVYRTVHACLPHVIERRGYILVVASAAALVHAPGMAAYAMSKAGAEAFADSLRQEVHHHGVRVGVGYFSWIDTDLVRGADSHPALAGRRDRLPSFARKTYPVSAVGDAVLEGVERRSRTVVVPGWVRVMKALRGVLSPLSERASLKQWPEDEAAFERDVAERGAAAASRPVGAGGEAASALRSRG
jgi:NAD(P)-dependent dehydrogenase (short-subunit alcohol dehydrogenase family)